MTRTFNCKTVRTEATSFVLSPMENRGEMENPLSPSAVEGRMFK